MAGTRDLERFVSAQRGVYERALAELRSGHKQSHWMWFIFPQIAGLGSSPMTRRFAIGSLDEAKAYLEQLVLGARLRECTQAVLGIPGRTAHEIFGSPDDLKFHSCMTLFELADGKPSPFTAALQKYFAGARDGKSLALLAQQSA